MSWKSDKAIERIVKLFKRVKNQVFDEDIEAIKTINETIALNEQKFVNDNILYAKLLCYIIDKNLNHCRDIKSAIKIASDILKEPLDYHLQILHRDLNDIDQLNFFTSLGYDFNSYKNQNDILKVNEKEIIEKLKSNWDYKKVEKSFYNTANEFLKDTNNYI